uniref:Optional hypothetical component of the B12 transporter BtuN n=1 Tax=Haliea sp. ETY-M TaxID=1055105 RepID=A0A455R4Y1_9GAMM|nr:optional hypothetical component of the B12 transporter BtuN [Haliea sp. ETY-M]
MAWFGPQAAKMMPPAFAAQPAHVAQLESVVATLPMREAAVAKLVPTEFGAALQITTNERAPRRYFSLDDGSELRDHDRQQARWLAAHYLDVPVSAARVVRLRTEFDSRYPDVNRLLPVYELAVERDGQQVTAYVYTETGALAALSDGTKMFIQSIFQNLHTWKWLDAAGFGRVLLIALFMISLLTMASSGLYLLIALTRRKSIPAGNRRWHRKLAYALVLPLTAWSASGFYHLLQAEFVEPVSGIRFAENLELDAFAVNGSSRSAFQENIYANVEAASRVSAISLIASRGDGPLYRIQVMRDSAPAATGMEQRQRRFDGESFQKSVVYLNATTGTVVARDDRSRAHEVAQAFVTRHGGSAEVVDTALVTRFGAGYDFRNKRLPVWQLDLGDAGATSLFVDVATGIVVDRSRRIDRVEALVFSMLHKWNFMNPFLGRVQRDSLIIATLLALLILAGLGVSIRLRKQRVPVPRKGSDAITAT